MNAWKYTKTINLLCVHLRKPAANYSLLFFSVPLWLRGAKVLLSQFRRDPQIHLLFPPQRGHSHFHAYRFFSQQAVEHVHSFHHFAGEAYDYVAFAQACAARGAAGFGSEHEGSGGVVQVVVAGDGAVDGRGLGLHADVASPDFSGANQAAGDVFRRVDRDGEAQALRGQNRRGVDAHDLAPGIDQRAAGVAGVERGVCLDDVVDKPAGLRAQGSSEGADDSGGQSVLKAVGVADGDDQLSHADFMRVAQAHGLEDGCVNAQQREIGVGVFTDQRGGEVASVEQKHSNGVGLVYHMAVGEDESVGGKGEPRAAAAAFVATFTALFHHDSDHRRADGLGHMGYDARVGVERFVFIGQDCRIPSGHCDYVWIAAHISIVRPAAARSKSGT